MNLDLFWLKGDALEESANLPAPEIIAQEITDDLEAGLEQFATIADELKKGDGSIILHAEPNSKPVARLY